MARLPRYAAAGQPQHVIQRGNNRCRIFATAADYSLFRDYLAAACAQHECLVHAYVLMTNHIHLLLTPSSSQGIGKVMQSVGRKYVHRFNRSHGRTGTLWEGRYRATAVDSERYLLACQRYIELNPVRAGLGSRPEDYRWSSYGVNAMGTEDRLVTVHAVYERLGLTPDERRAAYRQLFAEVMDARTLHLIRARTNHAWALGSKRFRADIAESLGRRASPLPRGGRRGNGVRPD